MGYFDKIVDIRIGSLAALRKSKPATMFHVKHAINGLVLKDKSVDNLLNNMLIEPVERAAPRLYLYNT
ncbi:hypothetical protein CR155_01400 [Pollutimonas nitritireducens]|uniref:Uncharacterized protein n=1 Tax=Pollutimonas nitritireducens TaxID=2045209 RepID=A0A2N4UL35_9BURK|nr:hypothetical protein CR155_01400 [Pollutimonas nitritireducens]